MKKMMSHLYLQIGFGAILSLIQICRATNSTAKDNGDNSDSTATIIGSVISGITVICGAIVGSIYYCRRNGSEDIENGGHVRVHVSQHFHANAGCENQEDNTHSTGNGDADDIIEFEGDNHCFSNFYPSEIKINEMTFLNAEHFYQYKKADYHGKEDIKNDIKHATTTFTAREIAKKNLDRKLKNSWMKKGRIDAMQEVIRLKFKQHETFRNELRKSKKKDLRHTSTTDDFWGVGKHSKGQNKLGKLLMQIRDENIK